MRIKMRSGVAALAVLATVVTTTVAAEAATSGHNPYPSQQQVDQAKAAVQQKLQGVQAIQQALLAAQNAADAANTKAEVAAEAYNGAMWKLSVAQQTTRDANAKATSAANAVSGQRDNIGRLAAASYQNSSEFTSLNAVLGGSTPTEMLQRAGVVQMANAPMQAAFKQFQQLNDAAQTAQVQAQQAEIAQQTLASRATAAKNAAAGTAMAAQQTANQVAAQRSGLLQQLAQAEKVSVALATQRQQALEQIAREQAAARARAAAQAAAHAAAVAAAARAAAARNNPSVGSSGSSTGASLPPAPSGSIGSVIAFAKAQLGDTYVWGGAGPTVWDCSGLTMMAFRQIGIDLPHYAASQYTMGTPIAISDARPGDLYFWSSDGSIAGIHHVAIALGNGAFIEAPHTGANVRYNNISNWYPTFAARM